MTPPASAPLQAPVPEQATHVVLPFLVGLRWAVVVVLAAAGWAAAAFWTVQLPLLPLGLLLAALVATNAALSFQLRSRDRRRGVIGAVLLLDTALLTGVLYLAGGPLNPLSIAYLVGITVAAVALGHRWAFVIAIAANAAYGWTFVNHRPLVFADPTYGGRIMTLHLSGMWIAFAAAAGLIAHFVSRVSEALERRERELEETRTAAARSERLAALLSLGAGAAHELATPLSTISTAAVELERAVATAGGPGEEARGYVALIRGEVDRCTRVLDQLSGRAMAATGHDADVTPAALVEDLRYRLGASLAGRLEVTLPPAPRPIAVPAEPLRQTLVALLRNAFDASVPQQPVRLQVEQGHGLRVEIVDRGRGMTPDEVRRAGEPFFTTKPPGAGLGLGLFLARAFADQMGGTLRLQSAPGEGTSVVLDLPAPSPTSWPASSPRS